MYISLQKQDQDHRATQQEDQNWSSLIHQILNFLALILMQAVSLSIPLNSVIIVNFIPIMKISFATIVIINS